MVDKMGGVTRPFTNPLFSRGWGLCTVQQSTPLGEERTALKVEMEKIVVAEGATWCPEKVLRGL